MCEIDYRVYLPLWVSTEECLLYTMKVWKSSFHYKAANKRGRNFTCTDMEDAYISVQKITVSTDTKILEPP